MAPHLLSPDGPNSGEGVQCHVAVGCSSALSPSCCTNDKEHWGPQTGCLAKSEPLLLTSPESNVLGLILNSPGTRVRDTPGTTHENFGTVAMLSIQEIVDLHSSKPLAAGFGLLSHYIFANYELDVYFHIIIQIWTAAWVAITSALYLKGSNIHSISDALVASTSTAAVYFGTILLSMTIYRAFFHRLRRVSPMLEVSIQTPILISASVPRAVHGQNNQILWCLLGNQAKPTI